MIYVEKGVTGEKTFVTKDKVEITVTEDRPEEILKSFKTQTTYRKWMKENVEDFGIMDFEK